MASPLVRANSPSTTGSNPYQPLDHSPPSSPRNNAALADKVSATASRGGVRNVLTSVSNALSKVGQLATQAKRECIAHLKKLPLADFAATMKAAGFVASLCIAIILAPLIAFVVLAVNGIADIAVNGMWPRP